MECKKCGKRGGRRGLLAAVVGLLLVALLVAGCAAGDTNFTNVVASGGVTAGGTINGAAVLATGTIQGLELSGTSKVTAVKQIAAKQTSITVTAALAVQPTGTYQPVAAASAITATVSTNGATAGQLLYLVNTSAYAITWTEVATNAMAGNFAMDQYDTLTMIFDGTRWVELARANN